MRLLPSHDSLKRNKRHTPEILNGKAAEYTEYMFKKEAYMSTVDPGGKK